MDALVRLNVDVSHVNELRGDIYADLTKEWESVTLSEETIDSIIQQDVNEGLRRVFGFQMDRMDRALINYLNNKWIQAAYAHHISWLREQEKELKPLILLGNDINTGLANHFGSLMNDDAQDLSWAKQELPKFSGNSPFDDAKAISTGAAYLSLMTKKLDTVSFQLAVLLTLRLRNRVQEVLGRMNSFINRRERPDSANLTDLLEKYKKFFESE
jgi:hypothetical protein